MDKLQALGRLKHDLKFDEEYADLSGYAADLEWLMKEYKSLLESKSDKPTVLKEKNGKVTKIEYQGIHYTRIDSGSFRYQTKKRDK